MKEKNTDIKGLISIIIPMFNSEKFISKLLDTVINQTYSNIEIIIINDGSTDNSLNIVKKYAESDDRIKIISTENRGVSSARNLGLKNVRGEYFTFLDSDDYIELDSYEKMINLMKSTNTDSMRINYVKEDENFNFIKFGDMYDLKDKLLKKEEIKNKLIPYVFDNKIEAYTPLLLVRSKLLNKINLFKEDVHMMEDMLFYLDLLSKVDNIYFFDLPAYHYILREVSNSKRRDKLLVNLYDTLKVVRYVEQFLYSKKYSKDIYDQVYFIYSTMIVKYLLRTFQKEDEYFLSYEDIVKILDNVEVKRIIKKVKICSENEYINNSFKLISSENYDEFYKYALSIKDIKI